MPTETDPKDLETTAIPGPPSDSDLDPHDETPAETDPVGTKEADAVAQGPEIKIDPPAEDLSGETEKADGGAEDQPSPEPAPSAEPEPEQPSVGPGPDADDPVDSAPSDQPSEPSAIPAEPDSSDSKPVDGPADGSPTDGQTDGEPAVLTPEVEPAPEDPKGPPSSEEVEATDAEFEPAKEPDPEPLPEEDTEPTAEPEGPYSGLHADKDHIGAALGKAGTDELLAAANKSFALVDLLRRVAAEAAEAERQEAQFLLGIGALWLAQLERWLARR